MQAFFELIELPGKYDIKGVENTPNPKYGRIWAAACAVTAVAMLILIGVGATAVGVGLGILGSIGFHAPMGLFLLSTGALMVCAGLPQLIQIALKSLVNARHHGVRNPPPEETPEQPSIV